MVPLRHRLSDGDTVEILTNPHQAPRKDWLEFAVSGRARSRIRHAVRAEEKERSRQLGREILERELRKKGLSLKKLIDDGALETLAGAESRGSLEDLFGAIGYGRLRASDLVRRIAGEELPDEPERPRRRSFFRRRPAPSSGIRVSGQPDVLVRFARCCNPLPGDDVVGFITRGRGVTVHVSDCPRAFDLDPARRINVDWQPDAPTLRLVKVRVQSMDQPGLLAKVTKTISAAGINISAARVATQSDSKAIQTFDLWVGDAATLNGVMRQIERIRGVSLVERLRA